MSRLQYLFAISITKLRTVEVAQWVKRWSSSHRVVQAEGSVPGGYIYQMFFFNNNFYFNFVEPNGLQDIVILCSRPNSCCQQNLKCFDMPL